MRRAVALLALVITSASRAEVVVGEVRDAEVHHEGAAEAWAHTQDAHGKHAHDRADDEFSAGALGDTPQDEHEDGAHEHGGSSDHCTHIHGTAAVSSVEWLAVPLFVSCDFALTLESSAILAEAHSPPPRS
jgi:hypothetical protein